MTMTPVELSALRAAHAPQLRPCRLCGAEMKEDVWDDEDGKFVCSSAEVTRRLSISRWDYKTHQDWSDAFEKACAHRSASLQVLRGGDPRVVAVIDELIALRAAAGEDMTIPVGAVYYPNGHGRHLCSQFLEHVGDGV